MQSIAWTVAALATFAAIGSVVWVYMGYLSDKLEDFSNEEHDE